MYAICMTDRQRSSWQFHCTTADHICVSANSSFLWEFPYYIKYFESWSWTQFLFYLLCKLRYLWSAWEKYCLCFVKMASIGVLLSVQKGFCTNWRHTEHDLGIQVNSIVKLIWKHSQARNLLYSKCYPNHYL